MWYCIFPRTCGFLVFWTVLEIILHVLQSCPNLFQFPIGHSQWNLPLVVTEHCKSLCRNQKKGNLSFWLCCRNQNSLDLTFINKFLITIFAVNLTCRGVVSLWHLSSDESVSKYCGIWQFLFTILWYSPIFFFLAVLRCLVFPNVPLCCVVPTLHSIDFKVTYVMYKLYRKNWNNRLKLCGNYVIFFALILFSIFAKLCILIILYSVYGVSSQMLKKNFVYSYFWFIYRARTNFFALVLFLKIAICKDKSSCSVL